MEYKRGLSSKLIYKNMTMIDVFMKVFQDIMDEKRGEEEEDDDDCYSNDDDEEEEEEVSPPPEKKQKLVTKKEDCLSAEEAVDIAFAAFDYFIHKKYDGDVWYIYAARDYGKCVCEKARTLKTEHKALFHASAIVDAFKRL